MRSLILSLIELAIVVALCISIATFWRDSGTGAATVRRLAAASAVIALVAFVLIYAGGFTREALAALEHFGASDETYAWFADVLGDFEHVAAEIVAVVNPASAEPDVYAHPPLWPLVLICFSYVVRFLIYRFHTRRSNVRAALTGSVYWSHITAYAMVMAFFIVIVGWSPLVVIPLSIAGLAAFIVSVKLWIEDLGIVLRAAGKAVATIVVDAARWVAYAATELAALVRTTVNYANRTYVERVRGPLRRRMGALEGWGRERRHRSAQRLRDQDARHDARFGRRDPPPEREAREPSAGEGPEPEPAPAE